MIFNVTFNETSNQSDIGVTGIGNMGVVIFRLNDISDCIGDETEDSLSVDIDCLLDLLQENGFPVHKPFKMVMDINDKDDARSEEFNVHRIRDIFEVTLERSTRFHYSGVVPDDYRSERRSELPIRDIQDIPHIDNDLINQGSF